MTSWGSFSYVFGPLIGALAIGLFIVILRWSHSSGGSLIQRPVTPGTENDYGLLIPVASPINASIAQAMVDGLATQGIRATRATTTDGLRIFVLPADEKAAQQYLASGRFN